MLQKLGGINQVFYVGRKSAVGEVSFASSKSGKVKVESGYALLGQGACNIGRGVNILGAGEAMRKESVGPNFASIG